MDTGKIITIQRVSTQKQGADGLGMAAQRKALDEYIAANDVEVVGEYIEVGSGRRKNRPILDQAIAHCKREGATLVVAKLCRLGRRLSVVSALLEGNIDIRILDFPAANRLTLNLMASIFDYESTMIGERQKAAIAIAKERGVKWGQACKHLAAENKRQAKDFASTIADSINQAISSCRKPTYQRVADKLNAAKVKTRTGKKFYPASVRNAMRQLEITF